MNFSSVVGYHMNPMTCGVAKFNAELARRLGVPFVRWDTPSADKGPFPLYSLKASELPSGELFIVYAPTGFGVFWHDAGLQQITAKASIVYYADPSLGSPGLWCPSLLTPSKPRVVKLFSFGMAGRLQGHHYARVRQKLEADGLDYHLRVSVGLHEGTSLSDATQHFDALRDIMGADKVTILGCLSDDAVAEELERAEFVLAFFEKGLRANNTTVQAALAFSRHVVSNCDDQTPSFGQFVHWINGECPTLNAAAYTYSWERLISEMESIYAATVDRQPTHQR